MDETKRYLKKSVLILLCGINAIIFTTPSWSQGIDWEGVLLDDGSNNSFNNRTRPRSNLPGVNTIPSSPRTSQQNTCSDGLSSSTQLGNSSVSSDGCNRKTPLIVIRDGKVDGILFNFPR